MYSISLTGSHWKVTQLLKSCLNHADKVASMKKICGIKHHKYKANPGEWDVEFGGQWNNMQGPNGAQK